MYYHSIETSWGWVAASWSENGLAGFTLPEKNQAEAYDFLVKNTLVKTKIFKQDLERGSLLEMPVNEVSTSINHLPCSSDGCNLEKWLSSYFSGQPYELDLKIDWSGYTLFQKQVLQAVSQISYGQVFSYCQVAEMLGKPRAARAVGNALSTNRHLLVVPCHRVIRQDGSLGGFGGRPEYKKRLLEWESACT